MNRLTNKRRQNRNRNKNNKNAVSSQTWSNIMATLSATILAISSIFTAFIGYSTWRHVQETSRPYFSIKGSPEVETPYDRTLAMRFVNAGDHPAEALKSQITMTLAATGQNIYEQSNHFLSTIPRETDTVIMLDLSKWQEGGESPFSHEFYLTLWLSYYDPLLQKTYEQNFFLRCNGLIEGRYVELTYMTQKQFKDLLDTIKRNHSTQPWNPLVE